jgi:hypothetical protein
LSQGGKYSSQALPTVEIEMGLLLVLLLLLLLQGM